MLHVALDSHSLQFFSLRKQATSIISSKDATLGFPTSPSLQPERTWTKAFLHHLPSSDQGFDWAWISTFASSSAKIFYDWPLKIIYSAHLVMAQWWHASPHHQFLHQHFASCNALHTMHTLSSIAVRSFFSSTAWEDLFVGPNPEKVLCSAPSSVSVSCFCDDDPQIPEHLFDKDGSTFSLRTKLEIRYSPWAMNMMDGFGKLDKRTVKELTGGPTGGGNGGDDDDGGEGGGDGGDEGGDEHIYILPLLTIAFAAFHLGYCIAVWMKHETLDFGFFKTGVGLFFLLAVAAIRLNNQTGVDAYILGLGASVGVMLWTGEQYLVQKEGSTGIVTLFAAAMAAIFTAALYKNLL